MNTKTSSLTSSVFHNRAEQDAARRLFKAALQIQPSEKYNKSQWQYYRLQKSSQEAIFLAATNGKGFLTWESAKNAGMILGDKGDREKALFGKNLDNKLDFCTYREKFANLLSTNVVKGCGKYSERTDNRGDMARILQYADATKLETLKNRLEGFKKAHAGNLRRDIDSIAGGKHLTSPASKEAKVSPSTPVLAKPPKKGRDETVAKAVPPLKRPMPIKAKTPEEMEGEPIKNAKAFMISEKILRNINEKGEMHPEEFLECLRRADIVTLDNAVLLSRNHLREDHPELLKSLASRLKPLGWGKFVPNLENDNSITNFYSFSQDLFSNFKHSEQAEKNGARETYLNIGDLQQEGLLVS
jgi:hypothetical protein